MYLSYEGSGVGQGRLLQRGPAPGGGGHLDHLGAGPGGGRRVVQDGGVARIGSGADVLPLYAPLCGTEPCAQSLGRARADHVHLFID